MNISMQVRLWVWVCCLLFVGRCTSLTFCDYCYCDTPDIVCTGVNFHEALNHTVPSRVASHTKFLNVYTFAVNMILANDTLSVFPALQSLTISSYEVSFVDQFVFKRLYELSYIYLERNSLHEIPSEVLFHLRISLQELHLVNQLLRNIPSNAFAELVNLQELTISYNLNYLDISSDAFNGLAKLKGLCLSTCNIRHLPNTTFSGLHTLQELDLSYNRIVEVPTAIQTIKSLMMLDLSYNTLLVNPMDLMFLRSTTKLQTLQMRYCAISKILPDAVDNLKASRDLTVANFDGNPFNCTEDLCSFASWYVSLTGPSTSTRSPDFIPFITLSPPPGKGPYQCDNYGKPLKDFFSGSCLPRPDPSPSIFPPGETPWHVVIIAVTVILVAFVVTIVSFVVWKFRLINYYHHRIGVSFQRHVDYGAVGDNNHEYVYDAYVSHHDDDKSFVEDEMLPRLEDEHGFDMCVSFRNFRLGSNLLENVSSAQDVSRAIIFIINERFMQNGQCKLELEMASTRMLEDETGHEGQRLIIILMEVLAPELVNSTLRVLLNHVAYLEWDPAAEERCWGQLIATLDTLVPERNAGDQADDNEHDEDQTV
eukprot:XP_003724492.2 PREDICTED: toll-like receptor 7 [Strongylocentrotus purpuratus]